jgi:SAM-dependent methyltransferase
LVDQATEVRGYYEANTPAFERYSQSGAGLAIRRAVWGPGVSTRVEAFHYVDRLIAEEAEPLRSTFGDPLRICDFGCGVGTSLLFLASRMPVDGTGVTISPLQARTSNERFRQSGFDGRLRCIEGDFLSARSKIGSAHLVLSIEAFVHSPEPEAFFRAAAQCIVPGGLLVICDDVLSEHALENSSRRERRLLSEFRYGWVAPAVSSYATMSRVAASYGFSRHKSVDLTTYVELHRPRDVLLRVLMAFGRYLPVRNYRWRSLLGGNALHIALAERLIEYRFMVWQRAR